MLAPNKTQRIKIIRSLFIWMLQATESQDSIQALNTTVSPLVSVFRNQGKGNFRSSSACKSTVLAKL